MNADVLTTKAADGIAVITLGSAKRIYFDAEMGDALTESLDGFAGGPQRSRSHRDGRAAPGYFNRHFNIPALIQIAESLRASGRQWPENATYNGGFFDKAMALCESMPKPVNCGHLRHSPSRCLRVRALMRSSYCRRRRLPDRVTGGRPWSPSRRRRHATAAAHRIGTPAALCTSSWAPALNPREAERKGLVHETVSGKALDCAMEIGGACRRIRRKSLAYI